MYRYGSVSFIQLRKAVRKLDFSLSDQLHPHGQYCPRIPLLHSPLCCTGYIGTIAIREQHSFSLRFILNYKLRTYCSQSTKEGLFPIKAFPAKRLKRSQLNNTLQGPKLTNSHFSLAMTTSGSQFCTLLYNTEWILFHADKKRWILFHVDEKWWEDTYQ